MEEYPKDKAYNVSQHSRPKAKLWIDPAANNSKQKGRKRRDDEKTPARDAERVPPCNLHQQEHHQITDDTREHQCVKHASENENRSDFMRPAVGQQHESSENNDGA